MFNTIIVQPILNLLVFIYALLPGHDFGIAIIIFTVIVRILLWPLIKKQLYHTKKLRELQPEIKKIKAASKGDRQKESRLTMELYKERQVSPFATIGLTLLQFPILIGLYIGLEHLIRDPHQLMTATYPFVRDLPWIQTLGHNISQFQPNFLHLVDLNKAALGTTGVWYGPALLLAFLSALAQYFQGKQLMPTTSDGRGLRQILRDAGAGKKADSSEMQAATGKFTTLIIPFFVFFITLRLASALTLYWFVSGAIAYWQQARILNADEEAMEKIADAPSKTAPKVIEGEVVAKPVKSVPAKKAKKRKKKGRR
jgi:YidC/Oxa1 family membrane protein insertase